MGHHYLCPVLVGLLIVQWYIQLHIPHNKPLGVYQWTPTKMCICTYTFLCANEVICILCNLVAVAHPDPNHYLCQLDCHSAQVTACMALNKGNATVKQIAHKLHWNIESVKHYMRDIVLALWGHLRKRYYSFFQI